MTVCWIVMSACYSNCISLFLLQVYEILARTAYGRRKRAEVGVARLLRDGAFTGAFPLHEVRHRTPYTTKLFKTCMSSFIHFQLFVCFLGPIWALKLWHPAWPAEQEAGSVSLLGQLVKMVQVSAFGSHPWILWRENSTLFCMAGYDWTILSICLFLFTSYDNWIY